MKTISIISQKGGAGKTTLAIHLAGAATSAGLSALILDADPQATASQWNHWRGGADPEVVDCASPTLLPRKVQQAADLGADLVIIDTPPHADIMAREACKAADLILIPCRPQAFDLSAVETTAELVKAAGKPAFVLFMGGPQRAPTTYRDARELIEGSDGVEGMGVPVAPVMLTMRAIYHHSTAQGKTAMEAEPDGKAAEEIAALWTWTREHVNLPTGKQSRKKRG
ncbi:plasmid segregation oscillating ATPase ParF [Sphingomonas sp. OV641]|uniref:ParA family partition ATPase n=1 Tax=Sphingomonas sp. OV641 TaxID=1881068 RepID=UPI0008BAF034|nr:ParA family partition ATPase [Sphingomonas sp. OV641]SEK02253.1 plasmid segregation oscillating ATPase ParF [Sphingomonas sp. OV641]